MKDANARRGRLNNKTFAIKDSRGRIFVTIPVLFYKRGDAGYDEMLEKFTNMVSDQAVSLDNDWCEILPMNSSTNPTFKDDDD